MIVFDGLQLIGLAISLIVIIIYGLVIAFIKFNRWRKTGFCKHDFDLWRTNSVGQHHWYKCKKCKEERLK